MHGGMPTYFTNKVSDKPIFSENVSDKPKICKLISIFYTNCNDLRNKLDELRLIPETYKNVKIICVTETMFNKDIESAEIAIPNFTPFRKDRICGKEGGGCCIYIHNSIYATEIESFNCCDSIAVCVNSRPFPFILRGRPEMISSFLVHFQTYLPTLLIFPHLFSNLPTYPYLILIFCT